MLSIGGLEILGQAPHPKHLFVFAVAWGVSAPLFLVFPDEKRIENRDWHDEEHRK